MYFPAPTPVIVPALPTITLDALVVILPDVKFKIPLMVVSPDKMPPLVLLRVKLV